MRHNQALLSLTAADSAALQFTVPAPDPVQAGETAALQALAVNTGNAAWAAGSYYWVGEVYDLDEKLVGRTDQVSPPEAVSPGAVASISLPFHVPDTASGRRLYRILLVKDSQTLISSPLKPFQIIEKAIPEPPKTVDYRVQGNVTLSYKDASNNGWDNHQGAETLNAVGKVKDSSYLLNAYILNLPGDIFKPFTVLFVYYAPWGTLYAGDIQPSWTELSVNGQGARGGMLEQTRGPWSWALLAGETVTSQAGTATTNGRFARSLYAGKLARKLGAAVTATINYFVSSDETASLSTDPHSSNFRGPSLVPQKNAGYGLGLAWEPRPKMKLLVDWQRNTYYADVSKPAVSDAAAKAEFRWERQLFKWRTFVSRAGTNFVSFSAPSVIGDRLTYDTSLSVFPASWDTVSLGFDQYHDNLAASAAKATTTNRTVSAGNSVQFKTGTSVNLSLSMTAAKAQPSTVLNNQTTTGGVGVSQALGPHNVSLNLQNSRFTDVNKLAHDLDTNTVSLSSTFILPRGMGAALGVSESQTKDKIDGSARASMTVSPSFSSRLSPRWTSQYWGVYTKTKNNSTVSPADSLTEQLNTEFTWAQTATANLTLGAGYNKSQDKVVGANVSAILVTMRYSYSF